MLNTYKLVILCASLLLVSVAVAQFAIHPSAYKAIENDDPSTTAYFWGIADPHVDPWYRANTSTRCTDEPCCRVVEPNKTNSAGKFGNMGKCDIPMITFQSTLDFIKAYPVNASFIYYAGDNVPHDIWNQTREQNLEGLFAIHNALKKTFGDLPIFPTVGNHDAFPCDQLDTPPMGNWFLEQLANVYSYWLPKEAIETVKKAGYYTVKLQPGLRIITLNSLYTSKYNVYLWRNITDPAHQLEWLESVLEEARKANEKVLIFAHIPPGIDLGSIQQSCIVPHTLGLINLVEKYQDLILGQFYGHVHRDFFKLFLSATNRTHATGVAYALPSVVSIGATNPAVRLFKYNPKTFELLDSVTFYSNLVEANKKGVMTFECEYSAKETYNLPNLSPQSWFNVWQELKNSTSKAWKNYSTLFNTQVRAQCGTPTDLACHQLMICGMANMDYGNWQKCTGL